ncbi:GWxTD domain-containing protein [bacterium]|nr:GWxTD domain-containing protein [bacterium]
MKKLSYGSNVALICILLITNIAIGQVRNAPFKRGRQKAERDLVFIKTWHYVDTTQNTYGFNIYVQLSNDFLQFIYNDNEFRAHYEITLNIFNKDDNAVDGKIFTNFVTANNYDETNVRTIKHTKLFQFHLKPEKYEIFISINDFAGGKAYNESFNIKLPEITELALSPPLFFYKTHNDSTQHNLNPLLNPVRSENTPPMEARFLITTQCTDQPIQLFYSFISSRKDTTTRNSFVIAAPHNRQWFGITVPDTLSFGQHQLIIQATQGDNFVTINEQFLIRWAQHSHYLPDLTNAVQALMHIMKRKEYKHMLDQDDAAQQTILSKFWKDRDPTPSTAVNELENEYYKRIHFSNLHFSEWPKKDGWQTDRGRIYILHGAPTQIERSKSYSGNQRKFEIWHYQKNNRKFLFVDRYGTGSYSLYSEE